VLYFSFSYLFITLSLCHDLGQAIFSAFAILSSFLSPLVLCLFTGLVMNPISARAGGICAARNCITFSSDWAEYLREEKAVEGRGKSPSAVMG